MKVRTFSRMKWAVILLLSWLSIIVVVFLQSGLKGLNILGSFNINATVTASIPSSSLGGVDDEVANLSVILLWTKYHKANFNLLDPPFHQPDSDLDCFTSCKITVDKRYLAVSDAVVFHSRDLRKDDMPVTRWGWQHYVYLQQESPSYTYTNLREYHDIFNWTMTYRQDSDVYHPYFITRSISKPPKLIHPHPRSLQNRSKLVAWIVSHCGTIGGRETYVTELLKFIPVDIYGACGSHSCPHGGEGCLPAISSKYKFYLSFENSLCEDYITEKFFNALRYNLVPVVYGGGDYERLAPPGAYINSKDFASPQALAEYLLLLHRKPEKYLEYFKWKTKYQVDPGNGWCSLCRKIARQKVSPVEAKSYADLLTWWHSHNRPNNQNRSDQFTNTSDVIVPACCRINFAS